MGRQGKWWTVIGLIGCLPIVLPGCMSSVPPWAQYAQSPSLEISEPAQGRVVRLQTSEGTPGPLQKPQPLLAPQPQPPQPLLPPPPGLDLPPPPPGSGAVQVSLKDRGMVRVSVRSWVNGQPIFDEEVKQMAGPGLSDARRAGRETEFVNGMIEQIVEQELMYQDAVKKLLKGNPTALDQLKRYVELEFDKTLEKMRKAGYPEDQIKEVEPVLRRMMERNLISSEYARSRIKGKLERIGLKEIDEYYRTHLTEFRSVDKVVWQDIFIPLGPELPTVEHARRFGEDLINKCRTSEDFQQLMKYNTGDSTLRNGEGLGQRFTKRNEKNEIISQGDIRPAELEEHLYRLREGEIGPVIAFTTGVHLIRVTKREYDGQLPLNDQVQRIVRKKLENELADREYKSIVRELKVRAIVRLERDAP